MDYQLTDTDIEQILPGVPVISYPELHRFRRIEDAFDAEGRVVILFLTTGLSEGHWVCLHRHIDYPTIEFFDSYGLKPDSERSWLSHSQLVKLGEDDPILMRLLQDAYDRGWDITFNPYHFQNERDTSETCGRHVATRLLHGGLSIQAYSDLIKRSGLTPDEYVLRTTQQIIGK